VNTPSYVRAEPASEFVQAFIAHKDLGSQKPPADQKCLQRVSLSSFNSRQPSGELPKPDPHSSPVSHYGHDFSRIAIYPPASPRLHISSRASSPSQQLEDRLPAASEIEALQENENGVQYENKVSAHIPPTHIGPAFYISAIALSPGIIVNPIAAVEAATQLTLQEPKEQPAPDGIAFIRKEQKSHGQGEGALGSTSKNPGPQPIFRQAAPIRDGDKWEAKVRKVTPAPPTFTSWYPGPGKHVIGTNKSSNSVLLDVFPRWSARLKADEQEHIDDITCAYRLSQKVVEDTINQMADEKLPLQSTPKEAMEFAESEFKKRLPPKLRPADLNVNTQRNKWSGDVKDSVYGRLIATTGMRDDKGWHTFRYHADTMRKTSLDDVMVFDDNADKEIGKHPSYDLIKSAFDGLR